MFDAALFDDAAQMVYDAGGFDVSQLTDPRARKVIDETTRIINRAVDAAVPHEVPETLRYALENDTFYEIFTSQSYYTETDEHPDGITLSSTMFSEMDSSYVEGGRILGGKTGYTDEAGLCLASIAEIDGEIYVLITAGAQGSHYTEPFHIYDALKLYGNISG